MAIQTGPVLKVVGLICIFLCAWVATGFIPAFPLLQGRVVIGRVPLFAAWWMPRWFGMGLHLLLAAGITGIVIIGWRFRASGGRIGLRALLLLMTLVAAVIGIGVSLPGIMTFVNG